MEPTHYVSTITSLGSLSPEQLEIARRDEAFREAEAKVIRRFADRYFEMLQKFYEETKEGPL